MRGEMPLSCKNKSDIDNTLDAGRVTFQVVASCRSSQTLCPLIRTKPLKDLHGRVNDFLQCKYCKGNIVLLTTVLSEPEV